MGYSESPPIFRSRGLLSQATTHELGPDLCQEGFLCSMKPALLWGREVGMRFFMPTLHQGSLLPIQRPRDVPCPQGSHSHAYASSLPPTTCCLSWDGPFSPLRFESQQCSRLSSGVYIQFQYTIPLSSQASVPRASPAATLPHSVCLTSLHRPCNPHEPRNRHVLFSISVCPASNTATGT